MMPADLGAVTTNLPVTSALFGESFPSKPTTILCVWCGFIISVVLLKWNNGLSIANENVSGDVNTFLKDMLVFDFSLTIKGPCAFGAEHEPNKGNTYSPPIDEDNVNVAFVSIWFEGS